MHEKENVFRQIVGSETVAERAYQALKELLESGEFAPGQKLPSEDKIARQFNISRVTLRTALQKLELKGYVDRKRGVGTFVVGAQKRDLEAGIERLVSISDVMRERGHVPGTKETIISADVADKTIAEELQIAVGDPITVIGRVRTMDGIPLIYDHSVFPAAIVPQDVTVKELGESLFSYIIKNRKLNVTHAVARLVPAMADDFLAEKLSIKKGTLLIRLVQVHYTDQNGSPIWQTTLSSPDSQFTWYIIRTR